MVEACQQSQCNQAPVATSTLAQEWEILLLPPAVKSGQTKRGNPYSAWSPAFNHEKKKGIGNKGLKKLVCHWHSWHMVKNLEEYSAAGDSLSNSVSLTTIPPLNFSSWRINVYTNRWIQSNLLPSCNGEMSTEVFGAIWHIPYTRCPRVLDEQKTSNHHICWQNSSTPLSRPQPYRAILGVSGGIPALAVEWQCSWTSLIEVKVNHQHLTKRGVLFMALMVTASEVDDS